MNVHAREARTDDRSAIIILWKRLVTEEKDAVDRMDNVDEAAEKWAWRLDRQIEEGFAFVVVIDEEIVGFTCYIGYRKPHREEKKVEVPKGMGKLPLVEGVAFINEIYLAPVSRKSKAAKLLFEKLVDDIRARGYNTIWTNTNVRNRKTQILLERIGFKRTEAFTLPSMRNQVFYEWKIR